MDEQTLMAAVSLTAWVIEDVERRRSVDVALAGLKRIYAFLTDTELEEKVAPTVGYDTDGTAWMTVRYVIDVQVMADNAGDALYYADLALQDNLGGAEGEVL